MRRFALPLKILSIYLAVNLLVLAPVGRYLLAHINDFPTSYAHQQRLFFYNDTPALSLAAHWINDYPEVEPKVIIIGDSKTEDFYVRYEDSIVGRLDALVFSGDRPHVFNFGVSGTKASYAWERVVKAAGYRPSLIIWQLGEGSFSPPPRWVTGRAPDRYLISLGGDLISAYANLSRLSDENAPLVAQELRSQLVPLYGLLTFWSEWRRARQAAAQGIPLPPPNAYHLTVPAGQYDPTQFTGGRLEPFSTADRPFDAVGAIARYLDQRGIPLLILVAPINPLAYAAIYEPDFHQRMVDELRRQTAGLNVRLLDLGLAIPPEYFVDGGHLKEAGNELVARALADYLAEHYPWGGGR
ncbi:MAG: hypothetical protein AB1331_06455 [Bacillota bacterium]